jgi:YHS domain-containing protein
MKPFILLLFLGVSTILPAQQIDYNTKKGFVAEGYDVVAYFNNKAENGDKKFATEYEGVKFKFSSKENLETFKESPKKYVPAYGGYCAYAIGVKGEKVSINPKTFEIRDGKLYLFYNSWGTNTLELWQKEGAEQLKIKADKNWNKIINK